MKPTQALNEAGQSLWLDNITRPCSAARSKSISTASRSPG